MFSPRHRAPAARPLVLLALLLAACAPADPVQITDARVREPIPGQDKTVGYFTLHNGSASELVIVGADSEAVRTVEMHVTRHDDGMVRMRRLREVVVPAGDTVRFEPGGRHLMLFGVAESGGSIEIVLESADGRTFPARFEVVGLAE